MRLLPERPRDAAAAAPPLDAGASGGVEALESPFSLNLNKTASLTEFPIFMFLLFSPARELGGDESLIHRASMRQHSTCALIPRC